MLPSSEWQDDGRRVSNLWTVSRRGE